MSTPGHCRHCAAACHAFPPALHATPDGTAKWIDGHCPACNEAAPVGAGIEHQERVVSAPGHCRHCAPDCDGMFQDGGGHHGQSKSWYAEWDDGHCPACGEQARTRRICHAQVTRAIHRADVTGNYGPELHDLFSLLRSSEWDKGVRL